MLLSWRTGWRGHHRSGVRGLAPFLVLLSLLALAPAVRAQNALAELNRILGRSLDPKPPPDKPARRGSTPATRVDRPAPPVASAGTIGHVDLSLLFRLHPVMRLLQVPAKPGVKPYFVKKDDVLPLVPSSTWLEARKAEVLEKKRIRRELHEKVQVLEKSLNSMPRSAADALNKLPRNIPAAKRKEEEQRFHQRRADLQADIQRTRAAIFEIDQDFAPTTAPINATARSRIQRDLADAAATVAQREGVGVVLNMPRYARPALAAVASEAGPRQLAQKVERNQNWLHEFFEAPLRSALDRHLLNTYLGKWEAQRALAAQVIPASYWQPAVLYGGVDLNGPVLRVVWEKYRVDEARIGAVLRFLEVMSEGG